MKRQIVICTFALAAVVAPSFGPTVAEARARQRDAGEAQVLVPVIADAIVSAARRARHLRGFGMISGPGRYSPRDGWARLTPEERERFRRGIAQARGGDAAGPA